MPRPDGGEDARADAGDPGDEGSADTGAGELPDAGPDAPDAAPPDAGEVEAPDASDARDAGATDSGPDPTDPDGGAPAESSPSQPAEVLRSGSRGTLLRGTLLTPTGVLDDGELLIVGNEIECVADDCSALPAAAEATLVETHGIISPGLIDAHNHLAYDFLDEWLPTRAFGDRYEWSDDPSYEAWVAPYADGRSSGAVYCPAAKWGEFRAIVHGTTTMQGQSFQQSCVNGLMRNAEHYDGLGWEQLTTNIGSVRDLNDAAAATLITRFTAATNPLRRYAVHLGEGIDAPATLEFDSFAGRDPRDNRHRGTSLLAGAGFSGVAVLIHALPLSADQLMEVADSESKVVWSPSSNLALYGATADVGLWLSMGVTIGIGPDWTPSGEDDMLAELRFARRYAKTHQIAELTSRRLWEMATLGGAEVVGLSPSVGQLSVGSRADVLVIGRTGPDPYDALLDADARDVRLVMVDGVAYYGDANLQADTAVNEQCEPFSACGEDKFLCAAGLPATGPSSTTSRTTETLADVEGQLLDRLASYARTDLLPLTHECR